MYVPDEPPPETIDTGLGTLVQEWVQVGLSLRRHVILEHVLHEAP
jgi:hypothetical protein